MMQEAYQATNQQEQDEYQQVTYHRIEELESYGQWCSSDSKKFLNRLLITGIAKADITKLKAGGYHTIESVIIFTCTFIWIKKFGKIAHSTLRKLVDVKGISEQKAQKLKDVIKAQQLVSLGFQTASSRLECMKDIIMISTGCSCHCCLLAFINLTV